jgi:hypothetical protein
MSYRPMKFTYVNDNGRQGQFDGLCGPCDCLIGQCDGLNGQYSGLNGQCICEGPNEQMVSLMVYMAIVMPLVYRNSVVSSGINCQCSGLSGQCNGLMVVAL